MRGRETVEDRRLYIIDDDPSVRTMIRRAVTGSGIYSEEFSDAVEFLSVREDRTRGCILLDLRLPGMDGLGLLKKLKELNDRSLVIMISGQADFPDAVSAIKLGAFDFIQKPFRKDRLLEVLKEAYEHIYPRQETGAHRPEPLNQRELEVVRSLARGHTNKEVARELGLSPRTVEVHRANILSKLGAKSATQAVLIVRDQGLL
jgi:two-component system, LuxR family, response regulator FixJ